MATGGRAQLRYLHDAHAHACLTLALGVDRRKAPELRHSSGVAARCARPAVRADAADRPYRGSPRATDRPFSIQEHTMRKVLRGYTKDKNGNLILIGTTPLLCSKDK